MKTDPPAPRRPRRATPPPGARGGSAARAQLTLVEHALCPLDPAAGLREGLVHRAEFLYLDPNRHQRTATARVICPFGLSPADELYLWGLIALTLSQPDPSVEFYATPHYCLTELGVIAGSGRGGKTYALFRQAVTRLAAVTYLNDRFYDPVRGEHRDVAFGFLSYSLPADPGSSRAWRFVWDPIFFEFCQAARGGLVFDLETYRGLDFAGRRLFLLLKKIFWRQPRSPAFDARHLGVNVLGFSPGLDVRDLKVKLGRVAARLAEQGIVAPAGPSGWFVKKGVGSYTLQFQRGPYFERPAAPAAAPGPERSPLYEPLRAIGFDDAGVARVLARYRPQVVQVWADITLAAKEKGPGFFKVGPEAYFLDNVEHASRGRRTPPDWWHEHRKEEERRQRESRRQLLDLPDTSTPDPARDDDAFEAYLRREGRAAFEGLVDRLTAQYREAGQSPREAGRNADAAARTHLRNRFRQEQPAPPAPGAVPLGDVLRRLNLGLGNDPASGSAAD